MSARGGRLTLFIAGPILLVGGVIASSIEWARLTAPTPMPTLPVEAYTGYHYTTPSYALSPVPLYLFAGAAVIGLVFVVVALTLQFISGRAGGARLAH